MIYFWQNQTYELLQSLYKHNETRKEENKLTFPDESKERNTLSTYSIYNTFWISYIYYQVIRYYNDDCAIDKGTDEKEGKDDKVTNKIVEDEFNVFDSNMWTVSELAAVLSKCDILTREAGREMDKSSLMTRLKQVYYKKESSSVYKPSPLGHNWRGFWSPYISDITMTLATVIGTIAGVHYLYSYCEHYHYALNCSNWRKMYSMECYILKKARSYLEEMNYNIVYTTLCGLGIALTGMLSRAKAYAARSQVLI